MAARRGSDATTPTLDGETSDSCNVCIIGGAGYMGLPFSLAVATGGHDVTIVDIDEDRLAQVDDGVFPFSERGGQELLDEVEITTSTEHDVVADADVVVLTVGTPVDKYQTPDMSIVFAVMDAISPYTNEDQLLILRSTVAPGVGDAVANRTDAAVVNAPERARQHYMIEDTINVPQLLGAPTQRSYEQAKSFFETFMDADVMPRLSRREAELAKIFGNVFLYVTFALGNEYWALTEHHGDGDNVHRILEVASKGIDWFNPPGPGANTGGPCLRKDGWFVSTAFPATELYETASSINNAMPSRALDGLEEREGWPPEKIAVLGMTFKADADDMRGSLADQMHYEIERRGYGDRTVFVDPHNDAYDELDAIDGADWVLILTPHSAFEDFEAVSDAVGGTAWYCDIWGLWNRTHERSDNGYFKY
ncbi:nucleotide sugar dehydrogenase (plasmid) [Halorarum halophilum]|uniref:UDP-N-acetyl-D-mannosamine dehydrogenase n=1 Tax=Halorarum halophilum TaxID=2743090 RepID=A0A7D5KYJ7_9EURY|nr:nucleotide sugar dehydrogenase [Halobaculum halophilum]QLG30018.1 nucleotide sugar dehydrogenase [Halobaculum halophilum]